MLRFIHNTFFAVFFLAALIHVPICIAKIGGFDASPLAAVYLSLETLLWMLFLPFFVALFCSRKIPWTIYLPPLLVLLWQMMGFWPIFPLELENPVRDLSGSLLSLLIAFHNLWARRKLSGDTFGFFEISFFSTQESFPWRRFLLFMPISVLALASCSLASMSLAMARQLNTESAGHVRIDWDGVFMRHSVYVKDSQKIYLFAMIHIGDARFYDQVLASIPQENTVVLEEGVKDKNRLIKEGFDYSKVASVLRIDHQTNKFSREVFQQRNTVSADIDVSQLNPKTIEFLNKLGRVMNGNFDSESLGALFNKDAMNIMQKDLIQFRNDHLMQVLAAQKDRYANIVIPWGGLHLKDIAQRLEKQGYQRESISEVKAIDFLQGIQWKKSSSATP